jgi:uncharacterized protein YceK
MRYVLVGVLCVWLSGCASFESSAASKTSSSNTIEEAQLAATEKDELELHVYPQSSSEEAYVLRLKY